MERNLASERLATVKWIQIIIQELEDRPNRSDEETASLNMLKKSAGDLAKIESSL